jgi:hypothetical protein
VEGCLYEPGENLAEADFDTRGDVAVMTLHGASPASLTDVARQFYCTHDDDFQFLTVFTPSSFEPSGRYYQPIQNHVSGLGPVGRPTAEDFDPTDSARRYEEFDHSKSYESRGTLEGMIVMGSLPERPLDAPNSWGLLLWTLGQEFGHRWCCFVRYQGDDMATRSDALLDNSRVHWDLSVDSNRSVMGGDDWKPVGEHRGMRGRFRSTAGPRDGYSDLDLYLMGLYRPQEVRPFFYLTDPRGRFATKTRVSIQDVIRGSGPRVPPAGRRETVFRQAFVLVTTPDVKVTREDVRNMERIVKRWRKWFRRATHGRARIDTSLRAQGS